MTASAEIAQAGRMLRTAMSSVSDELAAYPGPVSGCDAQYTHLLEIRSRLRNALNALEAEVFVATPRTLRPGAGVESR